MAGRGRLPYRSRRAAVAATAGTILLVSACSSDPSGTAEDVIEGKLEEDIGLGELEATCDQPDEVSEGEVFLCTATTEDGDVVTFEAELTSDDEFSVYTTNFLTSEDLDLLLAAVADDVSQQVGAEVLPGDIECPAAPVLLDENGDLECAIIDSSTGERYEFTLQTGGLEPNGGPKNLAWQIGDLVGG